MSAQKKLVCYENAESPKKICSDLKILAVQFTHGGGIQAVAHRQHLELRVTGMNHVPK